MCSSCVMDEVCDVKPLQGEYEFSSEILTGKLAEVVYRNATQMIKGVKLDCSSTVIGSRFLLYGAD